MLIGRAAVAGLLTFLAVAACTGAADDGSDAVGEAAAITAYQPPVEAPGFCTTLATSSAVGGIAAAIGSLSADTGRVEARLELTGGIRELRAVLQEVQAEEGHDRLEGALERLVGTLTRAMDGPQTDSLGAELSDDLDTLGRLAQPVCEFPT